MLLWCRPHPSYSNSCLSCNDNVLVLLELRIYPDSMTKNKPHLSLHSKLGGLLSRPLETCSASYHLLSNASMATLVRAHSTAILTNREPSKPVVEGIFYALQVRTKLYMYMKNVHLKNIYHRVGRLYK